MKLAIFTTSLVLSLTVLELGLRAAGTIFLEGQANDFKPELEDNPNYYNEEVYEQYKRSVKSDSKKIITLGDSFTNGGNVTSKSSYPYNLFQYLNNQSQESYEVLNLGICGNSTRNLFNQLQEITVNTNKIKENSTLIIMVGAADIYDIPHGTGSDFEFLSLAPDSFIYDLRIYKMYRFIKVNLTTMRQYGLQDFEFENYGYERRNSLFMEYLNKPLLVKVKEDRYNDLQIRTVKECEDEISDKYTKQDNLTNCIQRLAEDYVQHEAIVNNWGSSIKESLKIMKLLPSIFWGHGIRGEYALPQSFIYSFQLQSETSAAHVLEILKETNKKHPNLSKGLGFKKVYSTLEKWEERLKEIDNISDELWKDFNILVKNKNLKIYIASYPIEYEHINKRLALIAKKYNYKFIDTYSYFSNLPNAKDYLEDDEHLTPTGYKLLAKFIGNRLKEDNIVK